MSKADQIRKEKEQGKKRSVKWLSVRKAFLAENPECAVCGSHNKLEAHHIKPFHKYPNLELDPSNLITLCENPETNCHKNFGHLNSWKSHNPHVIRDSNQWRNKIQNRP